MYDGDDKKTYVPDSLGKIRQAAVPGRHIPCSVLDCIQRGNCEKHVSRFQVCDSRTNTHNRAGTDHSADNPKELSADSTRRSALSRHRATIQVHTLHVILQFSQAIL
jgi:hypothetical protein